jgi:hypothetical protein
VAAGLFVGIADGGGEAGEAMAHNLVKWKRGKIETHCQQTNLINKNSKDSSLKACNFKN